MNYEIIYNQLVSKRKSKLLTEGYTEKHHIIPICMGGTNEAENFVILTAREHFIAHQILAKFYKLSSLIHAANCMANTNGFRINGKKYEWLKIKWITEADHKHSEKTKQKISDANKKRSMLNLELYGEYQTKEHRKKNSDANKGEKNAMYGKTHTEEARRKISDATTTRFKNLSEEEKEKIADATSKRFKGIPKTEEENKKNSDSTKKRWDNMSVEQKQLIVEKMRETKKRKRELQK